MSLFRVSLYVVIFTFINNNRCFPASKRSYGRVQTRG